MNQTITLPRSVVEQALDAFVKLQADDEIGLASWDFAEAGNACFALRAALDHPQNHVPDAGNMVTAGWKLVPVVPTREQLNALHVGLTNGWRSAYRAMLAAAPQPPTTKESSVVQPQAEQPAMTPIAQRKLDSLLAEGYTISGYSIYNEQKHQHGFVTGAGLVGWWKPDGMEYPQPQGEQEPVAWYVERHAPGRRDHGMKLGPFWKRKDAEEWLDDNHRLRSLYAGQPPQGEQEPVGFVRQIDINHIAKTPSDWGSMFGEPTGYNTVPVYTHPQPRREPLTEKQIWAMWCQFAPVIGGPLDFARAIERTHGIGGEA